MVRSKISLLARLLVGQSPVKRATKSGRPRDDQRQKVYRWEQAHVLPRCSTLMTLPDCRNLVEAAYHWWEMPSRADLTWTPPVVTDGRGRRHACGSRAVIKLPRWSRTTAIVLHECAHGISDDGHGPHFVSAYVALLVRFAGFGEADLRGSLKVDRVRVADCHDRAA